MLNLSGECHGCHRPSAINFITPCRNKLNDGSVCGFTLDTSSMSGGRMRRTKEMKHTGPPASGSLKEHSWIASGQYDAARATALLSGNMCFDAVNGYLCVTHPIVSGRATVTYPMSGTTKTARLIVLPANSQWQNLHPHFREDERGLVPIVSGSFTLTSSGILVSGEEVRSFDVWQSGQRAASYNPMGSGFIAFK